MRFWLEFVEKSMKLAEKPRTSQAKCNKFIEIWNFRAIFS
jgi:hypothetical protein